MSKDEVRITFKHYENGKLLEMQGVLPEEYNSDRSDFFILKKYDGSLEDIRKNTVVEFEYPGLA
jgi:hypothetical protein